MVQGRRDPPFLAVPRGEDDDSDLQPSETASSYCPDCDGLRLAQTLLRKRKNTNKQIFMVTDGKPSAVFDRGRLYRNSFGLDPLVLQKTFAEGRACRKNKIRVCTFMIAQDPYLIEFVEEFSRVCAGKAFYTGLDGLGEFIFLRAGPAIRKRP